MLYALTGATLHTVATQGVIEEGTILVRDGKISDIGRGIAIPAEARLIECRGKHITPGFVECHSHLIAHDWSEQMAESDAGAGALGPAITPDIDYYYNFDPHHRHLIHALRAGVTTASIRPGSGKVITGVGFVTKMKGRSRKEMVIKRPDGLKVAFGENPKRSFGSRDQMPSTRMGTAALLREALIKAQEYMRKQEAAAQDPEKKAPPFNRKLEPIVSLLKGEIAARVHAHRHDDIVTVLRIADEFNFKLSIEHTTSGHLIVDELKKRDIPCVVGPTFGTRGKVEVSDRTYKTPGVLERAGLTVAITTDASVIAIDFLRTSASLSMRYGMTPEGALKAITLNPAKILGIDQRLGSLEVGKDADLVVLSGYPLELTTVVERTYVNGELGYDRSTFKEDWEALGIIRP